MGFAGRQRFSSRWASFALGTSIIAIGASLSTPAMAQCAPDPTVVGGTTVCEGVDSDGIRITTGSSRVIVNPNATVNGGSGPAITTDISLTSNFQARFANIDVLGAVDGGIDAGVSILSGISTPGIFDFYGTQVGLLVADGGSITGQNGVRLALSPGGQISTIVRLDNAGSITGSGQFALVAVDPRSTGFASIVNRATGTIGAISGAVGVLDNAGMINGGGSSALDYTGVYNSNIGYSSLKNSGTIMSASSNATIANLSNGTQATNSGLIANSGNGEAVSGGLVNFSNLSGGRIESAGGTAIRGTRYLNLVNAGIINGDVIAETDASLYGSSIDSSAGTINGDLLFGAGDDMLTGRYLPGSGVVTGVSGNVDGGAGLDTLRVKFLEDARLFAPVSAPVAFEQVVLAPEYDITVTLDEAYSATGQLFVAGNGTFMNRGNLSGAGRVVSGSDSVTFDNAGSVNSSFSSVDDYAVTGVALINSGSIISANSAISARNVQNSGSIVVNGTGTGVRLFGEKFSNSGSILSTGGTAVSLSGSTPADYVNLATGRIEGVIGVQSSGIVNHGVIIGSTTGVRGSLDNRAGGVVTGGGTAAGPVPGAGFDFVSGVVIQNAGTINGLVNLRSNGVPFQTDNRYFAQPGGMLNGNLILGNGNMLVVEFVGSEGGRFAGISGTVSAENGILRYRVREAASAVLAPIAGFTTQAYELFDSAALALTAAGPISTPIQLAGNGSVTVNADIGLVDQIAFSAVSLTSGGGYSSERSDVTAILNGTLTLDHVSNERTAAASFGMNIVNNGVINFRENSTSPFLQNYVFQSPFSVKNVGAVTITGNAGIANGGTLFENAGTIVQTGATGLEAISGVTTVVNTGSIRVSGVGVSLSNSSMLTNSGLLESTGGVAVRSQTTFRSVLNMDGGTIAAGGQQPAIQMAGGYIFNAGVINGNVDLGYSAFGGVGFGLGMFVSAGGQLNGSLRFGSGSDLFLDRGDGTFVTGTIDGGAGIDIFGHSRSSDATVTLGAIPALNFESELVEARGESTTVTTAGTTSGNNTLYLVGTGHIVNTVSTAGAISAFAPFTVNGEVLEPGLARLTNTGDVAQGIDGLFNQFSNSGSVSSSAFSNAGVYQDATGNVSFENSGIIAASTQTDAVIVRASEVTDLQFINSGEISGLGSSVQYGFAADRGSRKAILRNTGQISGGTHGLNIAADFDSSGSLTIQNEGSITATRQLAGIGLSAQLFSRTDVSLVNSGEIIAGQGQYGRWNNNQYSIPGLAAGVSLWGIGTARIENAVNGTIGVTGGDAIAVEIGYMSLTLENRGTINGWTGTSIPADDVFGQEAQYFAGAIHTLGTASDVIVNHGVINGSIHLGDGDDRIENYGTIAGDVLLGNGNDSFIQWVGGLMDGAVDGGDGIDTFTIDSTGGGSVNGGQFVNFEIFNQIGAGSLSYSGAFEAQTISLTASQATVAEGTTVSSAGPVTFTGTDAAEQLRNFGAIAGGVQLGGGVDSIENFGTIGRSVDLGDGDDMFTQGAGSSVVGIVDGGGGRDGWIVVLNGDREGLGARTGFEHLGVIGSGTLSLTLDQDWDAIALAGTGLDLRLAGHAPGRISGGDGEEQLRIDGDVTSVSLGGGNDGLTLGGTQFAGTYVGGAGTDSLRFEDGGTVSLSGTVTGFETVALAGNELLVSGTLGAQGDAIGFGAGDQRVEILAGGTVAGALDLGEGADVLRLAAGARLTGSVSGGAGADLAILELTPEQALDAGKLQNFETLRTSGTGMLHFASGAAAFDLLESGGSTVMVDAGASLQAGALRFGDNSDRFTLAGSFTGQASLGGGDDVLRLVCNAVFAGGADAGAGNDRLEIAMGGTAATPVALGNASFTNFEVLDMQSGIVSYAGDSRFGAVNIIGGRLIGLAGSRLTGGRFDVAAGATFGSAGTVVGDVVVAGTLSPGASPGTMTVAGNVALSSRSTSLFELSAAASDQLRVSGALTIASGASLLLTGTRPLTPGVTLDLIVADGGITGSFASIDKPATIQGFLSQSATRLQLLGTFLADPTFSPQVRSTIDYVNAVLIAGQASPALIAAVPSLLTPSGGSNAAAFRQLGPEAHASASQFGTEQALNVVEAARSQMMTAPNRSGMFTFGQMLTNNRRLGGDGVQGTASARMQSYGGLAGLGWGREDGWIGAFVGYQDGHQTIADLGSRTEADSVMVGVQGQASSGALTLNVIAAHSDGKADTRRSVLGNMLSSRYALNSWISDVRASYAVSLGDSWSLQPGAGLTGIRTTRGNATETGAGPFGLTVETNRATRWFADGELTLRGGMGAGERFHPYISGGVRLQFDGRGSFATASFVNVATRFTLPGLERDRTLVTARAGMRYDATERLSFHASYAGEYADQSRHYGSVGLRLAM